MQTCHTRGKNLTAIGRTRKTQIRLSTHLVRPDREELSLEIKTGTRVSMGRTLHKQTGGLLSAIESSGAVSVKVEVAVLGSPSLISLPFPWT